MKSEKIFVFMEIFPVFLGIFAAYYLTALRWTYILYIIR
jgi:hypothetical protein